MTSYHSMSLISFCMVGDLDDGKVKTVYRLYEETSHVLLTDRVTFIFIELPKFKKSINELDGNVLEGVYFCFKNMAALEERPKVLSHQIFTKIFEVSELYNMDEYTRDKVLHKMTTERDLRNQMACARKEAIEEGLAEGREIGLAEGRAEANLESAAKLKNLGVAAETISKATGLSLEEIEHV